MESSISVSTPTEVNSPNHSNFFADAVRGAAAGRVDEESYRIDAARVTAKLVTATAAGSISTDDEAVQSIASMPTPVPPIRHRPMRRADPVEFAGPLRLRWWIALLSDRPQPRRHSLSQAAQSSDD